MGCLFSEDATSEQVKVYEGYLSTIEQERLLYILKQKHKERQKERFNRREKSRNRIIKNKIMTEI